VARPVGADADLGVIGHEDLVAMDLGVHETLVQVVGVGSRAHVVAHVLPVLHVRLDVGVVVGVPGVGHVRRVLPGIGDEIGGDGQRAEPTARALLVDIGGEGGLGLASGLLGGVGSSRK